MVTPLALLCVTIWVFSERLLLDLCIERLLFTGVRNDVRPDKSDVTSRLSASIAAASMHSCVVSRLSVATLSTRYPPHNRVTKAAINDKIDIRLNMLQI